MALSLPIPYSTVLYHPPSHCQLRTMSRESQKCSSVQNDSHLGETTYMYYVLVNENSMVINYKSRCMHKNNRVTLARKNAVHIN